MIVAILIGRDRLLEPISKSSEEDDEASELPSNATGLEGPGINVDSTAELVGRREARAAMTTAQRS